MCGVALLHFELVQPAATVEQCAQIASGHIHGEIALAQRTRRCVGAFGESIARCSKHIHLTGLRPVAGRGNARLLGDLPFLPDHVEAHLFSRSSGGVLGRIARDHRAEVVTDTERVRANLRIGLVGRVVAA